MINILVLTDDAHATGHIITFLSGLVGRGCVRYFVDAGDLVDASQCSHLVVAKQACSFAQGECAIPRVRNKENTKVFVVLPKGCHANQAFACTVRGAHDFSTDFSGTDDLFPRLELFLLGGKPSLLPNKKTLKIQSGHFVIVDVLNESVALVAEKAKDRRVFSLKGACLKLLVLLMSKRGGVVSREEAHQYLYGTALHAEDRKVDLLIVTLRKTFNALGGIDPISTERGVGYALK